MNFGLKILRPALISSHTKAKGTALICTVMGDLHDIGKNMVKMMLEGQGIDVIDLGVDVTPEMVATAIQEHHPDIVCLSALLTTTMVNQKVIIDYLVEHHLRSLVKIMVGGAPITAEFAREIQADAYASDAASAADIALTFLN
jgi:5-methyltetrahydrofolate--homocysteine methyltransferase